MADELTPTGRIILPKSSDFAYLQDELFAEPQPWHDPNVGYRGTSGRLQLASAIASLITGIALT